MKFKQYLIESGLDLLKPIDPSEVEDREREGIIDEIKSTKHTILADGSYHIHGDLDLSKHNLKSFLNLPVKISKVDGYFHCYNNQLTSLEGAPKEVGRLFYCYDNKLTSLEGAPEKVDGHFDCSGNELTILEGAPIEVTGKFDCSYNKLINLEGAPIKVGEDFNCSYNQLISLEGAPKEVGENFFYNKNPGPTGNGFTKEDVSAVSNVGS